MPTDGPRPGFDKRFDFTFGSSAAASCFRS
jgi:hypothetical protein